MFVADSLLITLLRWAEHMAPDHDRSSRIVGGRLAVAAGSGVAALIWLQPQQLQAPAWVAYVAAAAFVLAGLAILARTGSRLNALFVALTAAALVVPGGWVAFAPGSRECSFNLPFLEGMAPGAVCRVAFGLGTLIAALLFLLLLLRGLRSGNQADPS